ncbi:hypothetical protein EBR66_01045 [bacterium]|nr:hypothetical protein [bacterium]
MIKKFLLPLKNMIRADLFSGSLAVWNVRGGAAHFCLARPEPREARRGLNSVRAILIIHRQLEFFKQVPFASRRLCRLSARISNGFLAENEMHLSIRAKEIF